MERRLVNPFIYLFMCHGAARGCEARLIVGACIEPGIPREHPDEGDGKSHGERARILDSAVSPRHSALFSSLAMYMYLYPTVFIYRSEPTKCAKMHHTTRGVLALMTNYGNAVSTLNTYILLIHLQPRRS